MLEAREAIKTCNMCASISLMLETKEANKFVIILQFVSKKNWQVLKPY
jgi:hypothetical protein